MSELSDYSFQSGSGSSGFGPGQRRSVVVAVVALVTALAAGYYFFGRGVNRTGEQKAATNTAATPAPAPRPLGAGEPISLPPLDQTDALVRRLAGALSSNPKVTAWLATRDLIRTFVVVVENVSVGAPPAKHLRVLKPSQPFRVIDGGEDLYVDPRSYDRYTSLAAAVDSVDAAGAAKVYATLKPRLEEAYAELGRQEPFDAAVERAITALLDVPVVSGNVRVETAVKGIGYRYEDLNLESLTAAQKQLLRTGPRNTMTIQAKLREIARALERQ